MFDEFEIREYSPISMEQSDLFKKLNKIVYPEYYQNNYQNIITEKENDGFKDRNRDDEKKTSIPLVNKLNADEKSFLFHVIFKVIREENDNKDEFNLPYTELLRLISLIDFYDEKVFTEKYRDSNHYQILSQGLNHFKKEDR
jgi:hypothetical protein